MPAPIVTLAGGPTALIKAAFIAADGLRVLTGPNLRRTRQRQAAVCGSRLQLLERGAPPTIATGQAAST
jgi:hypothetical protein